MVMFLLMWWTGTMAPFTSTAGSRCMAIIRTMDRARMIPGVIIQMVEAVQAENNTNRHRK